MTKYQTRLVWCPTCETFRGIAEQGVSLQRPYGDVICCTCDTSIYWFKLIEIEHDPELLEQVKTKLRVQGAPV